MPKFQVKMDGKWQDYSVDEDRILKQAFERGEPGVDFKMRGQDYHFDFKTMIQKNVKTGKEREIRSVYDPEEQKAPNKVQPGRPSQGPGYSIPIPSAPVAPHSSHSGWAPQAKPQAAYAQPTQAVYAQPAQPVYAEAAQPSYQQPVQPMYAEAARPVYQQPVQPMYAQPAPVYAAQPVYGARPMCQAPYQQGGMTGGGMSGMEAGLAGGVAGLLGGMLLAEAFD